MIIEIKYRIIGIILIACLMYSCATVPVTGRQQLNLIPTDTILAMSFQQYDEFLKSHKLSTNKEQTEMVIRVGMRIRNAVEQYFVANSMSDALNNFNWEFNLVESDDVNAWCMPGGKVVVYTEMLTYTQNEAGLAVVMGHEIGHAVAAHGNERMSHMLAAQLGGMALGVALTERPDETQKLWMMAFGLGAQFGFILPYSRLHENEADRLGLTFMAMAGYDPNVAVQFWQRMAQQKGTKAPPEFMSTHPSDETRIRNIKELIPGVMPYYENTKKTLRK